MSSKSSAPGLSKTKFTKSIYFRLALVFGLVIGVIGTVQLMVVLPNFRIFVDEIEQRIHWELAADVAEYVQPLVLEHFDPKELEERLLFLQLMNPRAELYFLDAEGKILFSVAPDDQDYLAERIDVTVIKQVLAEKNPRLPVYGPNPRHRVRKAKIFSAAPIKILGQTGYLYIILEGVKFEVLLHSSGELFIVKNLAVATLFLLVIQTIAALFLFRYLTRSFFAFTKTVALYSQGDFSQRIPINTDDEIGKLAVAVNNMADQIVATQASRREMIASISHDLNSPLTSISGFVQLLRDKSEPIDEGTRDNYLKIIETSVNSQRQLVSDLFEFSKLEANKEALRPEVLAIDDIVDECVERLRPMAEGKNIDLRCEIPPTIAPVLGDAALLPRVVSNLVENAVNYTEQGGAVSIALREEGDKVEVRVIDNGIGIAEADLTKIFDSFFRVERHRSRTIKGSGLGLAIVKKVLELHGSEIHVSSTPGTGSMFWFYLRKSG